MKKISAIVIVLVMLFTAAGVSAEALAPKDMREYSGELEILFKTKILEADSYGTYAPKTNITRKEMCRSLSAMLKLNSGNEIRQVFADVSADSEYAGDIYALCERGIVSGVGGGMFEPDNYVRGKDLIGAVVKALGYEDAAIVMGGFPSGYAAVAESIDLLDGVRISPDEYVTKLEFARLIKNAVDTCIYEYTSADSFGNYTKKQSDRTLLSLYYKINKITDVITANEYTSLNGEAVGKKKLVIGDRILNEAGTDIGKYIGMKYTVYYDSENDTVICAAPDRRCSVTKITDLQEPYYEGGRLTYYSSVNGKKKTEIIPADIPIIYNNRLIKEFDSSYFNVRDGIIELIDNGGGYDVVKISSYENLVVNYVNLADKLLSVKGAVSETINLKDFDYKFFDANGEHTDESYVKEWDVLSALFDESRTLVSFYLSGERKSGKVTSLSNDKLYLDGREFEYSEEFSKNFKTPQIGEQVSLCLTKSGRIAAVKKTEEGIKLGYIRSKEYDDANDVLKLRILTDYSADGTSKFFYTEISKRITIDSEQKKPIQVYNSLRENDKNKLTPIITFELTDSKEIRKIDTLYHSSAENPDTELLESFVPSEELFWRSTGATFDGKTILKDNAVLFYAPAGGGNDGNFETASIQNLTNDKKYGSNYKTYKIGKDAIADDAMVFDQSANESSGNYSTYMYVSVIEDMYEAWDDAEEEIRTTVKSVTNGSPKTSLIKDKSVLADLKAGDVVKLSYNVKNEIDGFVRLFNFEEKKVENAVDGEMYDTSDYHGIARSMYGYVYRAKDGMFLMTKYTPQEMADKKRQFENEGLSEAEVERRMTELCEKHHIPSLIYVWNENVKRGSKLEKGTSKEIYTFKDYGDAATPVYVYSIYSKEQMLMVVK